MRIKNISDVIKWRLCVGCGACAYVCPEKSISLVDVIDVGIRPILNENNCVKCSICLLVCPGYETTVPNNYIKSSFIKELKKSGGRILEIWEGYSLNPDINFNSSSGGIVTSIAQFCMEKLNMYGTLHIGEAHNYPLKNYTYLSRNLGELKFRMGSRYSPASPCDRLDLIESAPNSCVFIGKPCDVAALRKVQNINKTLDHKLGLIIGIFCAGTPATKGTMDLLKINEIKSNHVKKIKYRGAGWPGNVVITSDENEKTISYSEAWGYLQRYRPFRCYLCPDGTSELADISCGDAWYREIESSDKGYSLILVRTEKGRKILHKAAELGYIYLHSVKYPSFKNSQKNLLGKKKSIWGRLLAMKLLGVPVPKLKGYFLFNNWISSSVEIKFKSIFGTIKRIIIRNYWRPFIIK